MACARSGSIFCWPRAVVFLLPVLCELPDFDLLLWVVEVLDFACVPAAFTCFVELAVFGLEASAFASADVCASATRGEIQAQVKPSARANAAPRHPRIVTGLGTISTKIKKPN
jgi:hypothetical protein